MKRISFEHDHSETHLRIESTDDWNEITTIQETPPRDTWTVTFKDDGIVTGLRCFNELGNPRDPSISEIVAMVAAAQYHRRLKAF